MVPFTLQQQRWVVLAETIWPLKSQIFYYLVLCKRKPADPCSRWLTLICWEDLFISLPQSFSRQIQHWGSGPLRWFRVPTWGQRARRNEVWYCLDITFGRERRACKPLHTVSVSWCPKVPVWFGWSVWSDPDRGRSSKSGRPKWTPKPDTHSKYSNYRCVGGWYVCL